MTEPRIQVGLHLNDSEAAVWEAAKIKAKANGISLRALVIQRLSSYLKKEA